MFVYVYLERGVMVEAYLLQAYFLSRSIQCFVWGLGENVFYFLLTQFILFYLEKQV